MIKFVFLVRDGAAYQIKITKYAIYNVKAKKKGGDFYRSLRQEELPESQTEGHVLDLDFRTVCVRGNGRGRGALAVTGNVTVDMDFLRAGVEVSFDTEASLDFITTVKFSEYPFLICIQMDKSTFPVRDYLTKYESLPSGKSVVSRKGRKLVIPGSEFPLHQENSNMCKRVFDSSW